MRRSVACRKRHRVHTVSTPPDGSTSHSCPARRLEQRFPAREQLLELVAGGAVRRERLDVVPVLGEPRSSSATRARAPAIDASTCSSSLGGRFAAAAARCLRLLACFGRRRGRRLLASSRLARSRPSRRGRSAACRPRPRRSARRRRRAARGRARRAAPCPGNASSAASSASRLSRSRWFVGSSSTRKFAPDATTSASASRRRSPPESSDDLLLVRRPSPRRGSARAAPAPAARCSPVAPIAHSSTRAALVAAPPRAGRSRRARRRGRSGPCRVGPCRRAPRAASSCPSRSGRRARRARRARARARRPSSSCLSPAREVEALGLDDDPPAPRGLQELEAERAPRSSAAAPRRAPASMRRDLRQLRLRLLAPSSSCSGTARRSARAARCPPPARSADFAAACAPRRLLAAPDVPRAGEERRAAALELEHRGRRPTRGTSGRGRRGSTAASIVVELLLEPLDDSHVEVVRRLVEQQQVGVARERARERRARQLAAGERVEPPVEIGVAEAEPAQDGGRAVAPAVAAARARAAPAPRRSGAASPASWSPPPSPPRAARSSCSIATRSAAPESAYSRSVRPRSRGGRWSCSATRVPFANASSPPCERRLADRARAAASSCRRRSGRRARAGRGARP